MARDAAPSTRDPLGRAGLVLLVLLVLLVAALAAACDSGSDTPDSGTTDGGADVAGPADGGSEADAGPPDAGPPPIPLLRNEVDLDDEALATQALALMGAPEAGGEGRCSGCHAITRQNIRRFWDVSDVAWRNCFANLAPDTQAEAQAIVQCFRDTDLYTATNLGVFATGGELEWFRYVFRLAFGEAWETEYERFTMRVVQSADAHGGLAREEFDLLTEWFLRGTPMVEAVLPALDGPGECTPYVDASVVQLVADGEATGWSARNTEAAILMHDCAGATDALGCLSSYPRVQDTPLGAAWGVEATDQRMLFTVPYRTSYWTKVSADGRFVAHGGNGDGAGSSVIDLERGAVVGVEAAYDPGFFPDNSGFMFQGTRRGSGLCMTDVLTTGEPTRVTFEEPGCSAPRGIALYQHVGASLDGDDYWVVTSLWTGDTGDSDRDPSVMVSPSASLTLHRLLNTGSGFVLDRPFTVDAPWQGNVVISPTMRVMVGQLADASGRPLGFVLRRIDITRRADGTVGRVDAPEVARYCTPGGKAAFSLDDRWVVTHHRATDEDAVDLGFTGPDDPAFAPFRGVSNVYLIDVLTGERRRVTNMQPGQRALFPSFRSDGWLYYLVRAGASGSVPEYVAASNAGIVWR